MKKCNMCGSELQDSYNACPNCGNTNLAMTPVAPTAAPAVQPAPQAPVMNNPNIGQPASGPVVGQPVQQPMYGQPGPVVGQPVQEKGNIGWGILGFFIPIVGWILYFVWKNTKPGNAKMAGIGGLIGFGVNLLITFLN